MAAALEGSTQRILSANSKDVEAAKARGMKATLLDRLILDERRVKSMARCLREGSRAPRPRGRYSEHLDKA